MKEIKKVAIIGLGAIGSIYAVKLHAHDPKCLRVIADKERLEGYKQDGLFFNGKRYDFNFALPDKNAEKTDLIIIATKSSGLESAVKAIEGFVGDDTVIMSPLNGITSEEIIARAYGRDKVLYTLFIGHISTRQGMTAWEPLSSVRPIIRFFQTRLPLFATSSKRLESIIRYRKTCCFPCGANL